MKKSFFKPFVGRYNRKSEIQGFRLKVFFSLLISLIFLPSFGQETVTGLLYSDNKPVSVTFINGKIISVKRIKNLKSGEEPFIIAPGLIDAQVNGFAGVSFTFGGGELTASGVKTATEALWKTGVTTYLPTVTTNTIDLLKKNLAVLAQTKNDPFLKGSVAGFHLEGPYISPTDGYRGAHPLKSVHKPDWDEFMELQKAAGNNIILITIAPETEGALDFISKCRDAGIIVALGHHNAPASTVKAAIDMGAQVATHLGNGCANMINRHLNPLWSQLADDRLMISIIGDGFHLNPEEIRVFYKVKGAGMTILTSDVTSYAGLPPGKFVNNEGDTLELTKEGMLKYPAQNVLYGSASPVKKSVENVMKVTGCTLEEAIRMTTINPARLYNLTDRGSIEVGKRADLIMFRTEDNEIKIFKTFVNGQLVYDRAKK